jgi:hypothetical protein
MAANRLQQTLDTFRQQLALGEEAFDRWQAGFRHVETDINRRLNRLSERLKPASGRPRLRVVTPDELAAI